MKNDYNKYNIVGNGSFSWQNKCLRKIYKENNVILSSPTGTGKTNVFLKWAKLKNSGKIYITSPIKALTNQRFRELEKSGKNVGIETGDIKYVPEDAKYICCTQEIYTNKYIDDEDATLIMDEFHYIFENNSRARTYIDSLRNSKAANILLCSATFGNIKKLEDYLCKVSNRKFYTFENKERAISLNFNGNIETEDIKNAIVFSFAIKNINKIVEKLTDIREINKENVEEIDDLAGEHKIDNSGIINNAKKGVAGYYGSLLPKEKFFIEKCFEKKLIDVVVGTDALALGVNLPAENVVFTQLAKYYQGPISKNLFEQLAGRAGRKGFYDQGNIFFSEEFGRYMEDRKYNIEDLYEELLEKENEEVEISINPSIKDILNGKSSIENEVFIVSNYSTEYVDEEKLNNELNNAINYILNEAFNKNLENYLNYGYDFSDSTKYQYVLQELAEKEDEYKKLISKAYFEEYGVEENCNILCDFIF